MTDAARTQQTQDATPPGEKRLMWLILLGPPLLWAVRFMLVYVLIEVACRSELLGFSLLGIAGVSLANLGFGLLTIALTAWLTLRAWGIWRQAPDGPEHELDASTGRRRSLALVALGIGLLMIFVTTLEVLPVFFIAPCGFAP